MSVVASQVPGSVTLAGNGSVQTFIMGVRTSLETDPAQLVTAVLEDWSDGMAMAANGTLWPSHVQEWLDTIWTSRVEIVGCVSGVCARVPRPVRGHLGHVCMPTLRGAYVQVCKCACVHVCMCACVHVCMCACVRA